MSYKTAYKFLMKYQKIADPHTLTSDTVYTGFVADLFHSYAGNISNLTNIVEQFFKKLPGQLFVLSTNEEISSTHMAALAEQTSSVFLLEYGDNKCTRIIENRYFEV